MSNLLDLARATGVFALPMLLLILVGLGAAPLLAVVGASRRLPVASWLLAPTLCAIFGGLSMLMGGRQVLAALEYVAPSSRGMIAAVGLSELLSGLVLSFGGAALILLWSALWAALGSNLGQAPGARWRAGTQTIAGGLVLVAAGALFGVAMSAEMGEAVGLPVGMMVLGGLALAGSGLRRGEVASEPSGRMEVAVSLLATLGLAAGVAAAVAAARADALRATSWGDPDQARALVEVSLATLWDTLRLGAVATGIVGLAGAISVAARLQQARIGGIGVDLGLCGLATLALLGAGATVLPIQGPLAPSLPASRLQMVRSKGVSLPVAPGVEEGSPSGAVGWEGSLLVREGEGWQVLADEDWARWTATGAAGELVLAVSADLPAQTLIQTAWIDPALLSEDSARGAKLRLLAWRADAPERGGPFADALAAMDLMGVELVTGPAEDAEGSWVASWVSDHDAPLVVSGKESASGHDRLVLSPDPRGLAQLEERARLTIFSALYIVPHETWTVQDLINLCLTAQGAALRGAGRTMSCLVGPELHRDGALVLPGGDGGVQLGDDPILIGAISEPAVRAVVEGRLPRMADCVEGAGALSGVVVVKFVIDKEGLVARAEVKSSTLGQPEVESCLVKTFWKMAFEPPKAGGIAIVSYPLVIDIE